MSIYCFMRLTYYYGTEFYLYIYTAKLILNKMLNTESTYYEVLTP
jgi:hypothetical protein